MDKRARVNRGIRAPEVRLITKDGDNRGVVPFSEALKSAEDAELDLVEISPTADPPVCQVMDYGKYLYEQDKKERLRRKHTKIIQIKEIKFRPFTDTEDYRVKCNKIQRFLESGYKVKVTLRFRGRELAHQDLGMDLLKRVEADMAEYAAVEQMPKREGRQMVMVFAPTKRDKLEKDEKAEEDEE